MPRRRHWNCCAGWVVIAIVLAFAKPADGQFLPGVEPQGSYPAPAYYAGLQLYRDGDIAAAAEYFDNALSQARVSADGRWIDSIPALAMLGECYYHFGDCVAANQQIEAIMKISIANRSWVSRVLYDTLPAGGVLKPKPQFLWRAAQAIDVFPIRDKVQYGSGSVVTEAQIAAGGTIEKFNVQTIDIGEVMRCFATAMHRRRILMGPLASDDAAVADTLQSVLFPANMNLPLGRSMIGSMRGCGYFASGDDRQTIAALEFTRVGGAFHPISPVSMVSALYAFAPGDDVATRVAAAIDAANVAAATEQYEWVGPALQLAAGYADPQTSGELATTAASMAAALGRGGRLAALHASIASADASMNAGNIDAAAAMLQTVAQITSRRDVRSPRLEAYAAWVAARVAAAQSSGAIGGSPAGRGAASVWAAMIDPAIAKPIAAMQNFADGNAGSLANNRRRRRDAVVACPRVFQMLRLPPLLNAAAGAATADKLIDAYLGDPPTWLWRVDPVDALGSLGYDRTPLHRTRMLMSIAGNDAETTLRAANDYSVERFLYATPLGGRAVNIRTLGWMPIESLPDDVRGFVDTAPGMKEFRTAVAAGQTDPAAAATLRVIANRMALSRLSIPSVALPTLDPDRPAIGLPDDAVVLSFTQIDAAYQVVAVVGKQIRQWSVAAAPVKSSLANLLRSIGVDAGKIRLAEDERTLQLRNKSLADLTRVLFPDDQWARGTAGKRLIVVPDGLLWYLPFEMLGVAPQQAGPADSRDADAAEQTWTTIGKRFDVSYAPTLGSIAKAATKPERTEIALAVDSFFVPRSPEDNASVVERLAAINPAVVIDQSSPPSGRMGDLAGHLLVASARGIPPADPLGMMPSPFDPPNPSATLASWLEFPRHVPHTAALIGIRSGISSGGDGSELFALLATLHAANVEQAWISRWAVGGESTATLLGEYLQEVAVVGLPRAATRAKTVLRQTAIDPAAEPLLGRNESERENITGDEPLFWAGYMTMGSTSSGL